MTPHGGAVGAVTRGTTNTNRLRRVDRWIAAQPVLRRTADPLVVDLGYGASGVTAFELHQRLARTRQDVEVLGLEIEPGRVRFAEEQLREVVERLNLQDGIDLKLYRPRGCPKCGQSGYHGRSSVVEVLPVSEQIRKAILRGADASTLQQIAIEEGMQSLYAHGVRKVLAGTTSVEELWRATRAT